MCQVWTGRRQGREAGGEEERVRDGRVEVKYEGERVYLEVKREEQEGGRKTLR